MSNTIQKTFSANLTVHALFQISPQLKISKESNLEIEGAVEAGSAW